MLQAGKIRRGTHITAIGSDTVDKIELEPEVLGEADAVVVDSLSQSETRGEVFRAVETSALRRGTVVELGSVVAGTAPGRENDRQVTVCDLTGVAVQDLMIAEGVAAGVASASGEEAT